MILEKNGEYVGLYLVSQHIFTGLTTNLSQDVDTAKAHASPYEMREQAAVVSCDFLVEWLIREDIEKAGCSAGAKLLQFFETPKLFMIFLWTHTHSSLIVRHYLSLYSFVSIIPHSISNYVS